LTTVIAFWAQCTDNDCDYDNHMTSSQQIPTQIYTYTHYKSTKCTLYLSVIWQPALIHNRRSYSWV